MTVFVDSSAFYAAADSSDAGHSAMVRILQEQVDLLSSDHVLVETWLLVNARLGRPAAERFLEAISLRRASALEIVTLADIEKAIEIGTAFADQSCSLVDRTSFALMERLGIEQAVSLDDDFLIYRYGRDRKRSFEVLR